MKGLVFMLHFIDYTSLFAPANNILQAKNTDLSTGMTVVVACAQNVHNLQTEEKFCDTWDEVVTQKNANSRQTRRDNTLLQGYVVEETTESNEMNKDEMRTLLYSSASQAF